MTGGSVKELLIDGDAAEMDLQIAWQNILQEYYELIKTDKSANIFELWKKILYTSWKIQFVDICISALRFKYDAEIAEHLMLLGYDYVQNIKEEGLYLRQLELVESEAKTLIVFLNQYSAEYQLLCPQDKQEEAANRTLMDYEKEITWLSKFMGYRIKKDEVTVLEYCGIVNTYLESTKKSDN